MSDCHELRELMPVVATGSRPWSPLEAGHLAGCPECSAEWRLVWAARRMGADGGLVDLERVVARRRALGPSGATPRVIEFRRRSRRWAWAGLSLAAAAALLLTLARPTPPSRNELGDRTVLTELDDLDVNELTTVLTAMDVEEETMGAVDGNLDGLTPDELEQVLGSEEMGR